MTSKNGKSWFTIGTAKNNVADDQYGSMLQKFGVEKEFKTRYIRIVAKTYGNCPPWHPGHGNPAHIFADEIIVNY